MVSCLFIFFAAIFNAIMDSVENERIVKTVFHSLNAKFWYKRLSWNYVPKTFGYKWDAWHMAKSLMIISLCLAVVTYHSIFNLWADFAIFGLIWNGTFNLFYNHIFKRPNL